MFENGWWEGCIPTSLLDPPLPAWITMSLTTTPTSRFGFSMICSKFCHSCVEMTARTAFAQFEHFTLKTKVRFEKGGGFDPQTPPGGATVTNKRKCNIVQKIKGYSRYKFFSVRSYESTWIRVRSWRDHRQTSDPVTPVYNMVSAKKRASSLVVVPVMARTDRI